MPPNSEIEKLERRWKENPKGTVFAPYAEVLRKNGDHLEARDVLRQGLELHPDHIPGNIVLGRCCLDLREDGPAEAAFTHVLDLDPENVIALKALADITERQGRLMEARTWLGRLMSVDPSNDEARDQLSRVDAAREAAAAAMAAPLASPAGEGSGETTATVEVIARPFAPQPGTLAETAAGEVADTVEVVSASVEEEVDAALDAFHPPPPPAPAPLGHVLTLDEADTVPVLPAMPRSPAPIMELEPVELDLAAAASELETEPLAGIEPDAPFTAPPRDGPEVFAIGEDVVAPLDLRPSGMSEFQAPDASEEMLSIAAGGRSEFQEPDASQELALAGSTGSEYQTPSGAEELLSALDGPADEPALVEPTSPSPPPFVPSGPVTTGFAAITLMPTEELSTEPPAHEPPAVEPAAPVISILEQLTEASAPAASPEPARWIDEPVPPAAAVESVGELEPEPDQQPEPEPEPEPEPVEGVAPRPSDLKLIFPDETEVPEAPRVRRISQEVLTPVAPEPVAEAPAGEPEPVVTETMAELYARQGHLAEALNVYRHLSAQQPNDPRLQGRIRELEQQRAAGAARRLSYVAMETGGESVESFFRAIAGARPAGPGAVQDDQEGAPTRPARDPLSLSAIFGEEAASAAAAAPKPAEPSRGPDAFSFDQFFGGNAPGATHTGPRQAMPSDEDLDQFQHWLKSLKR